MDKDLIDGVVRAIIASQIHPEDDPDNYNILRDDYIDMAKAAVSAIIPEGHIVVQGWQDISELDCSEHRYILVKIGDCTPMRAYFLEGDDAWSVNGDFCNNIAVFDEYMPIPKGVEE